MYIVFFSVNISYCILINLIIKITHWVPSAVKTYDNTNVERKAELKYDFHSEREERKAASV